MSVKINDNRDRKMHELRTPIDCASQTACLSREVKLKIEVEEMLERIASHFTNSTLTDVSEDGIQEFSKERCTDTCGAICKGTAFSTVGG